MPFAHTMSSNRFGRHTAAGVAAAAALTTMAGCSAEEPKPAEATSVYEHAVAAVERAGQGAYAVSTMTDGAESVRVDGVWRLSPASLRSTITVHEGDSDPVQSTIVEDTTHRWSLAPQWHDRDDCWTKSAASEVTGGVPGILRLLLDGSDAQWEEPGVSLTAQGPAAAAISALGDLGDLMPAVPDDALVEFTVLMDGERVTALRTDLGAALTAAEEAGVAVPEQLQPFMSEAVEVTVLAGFSELGEDVDTAPPAPRKVRTC